MHIVHGAQRAEIEEVGATLRAYRAAGRDVIDSFAAGEKPPACHGEILAPWPNRIADGRYRAPDGSAQQLPITEPARGNALHGLVNTVAWTPASQRDDAVELVRELLPQPGYPFHLRMQVRYALGDTGLECTLRATNAGDGTAPYGAGHHPYFTCPNGRVDSAVLRIPADGVLESDVRLIPTGRTVDVTGTAFDFRTPRQLGDLTLDHCFAQLHPDADGMVRVSVEDPQRWRTTIWMRPPFRWLMVFSSDTLAPPLHRRALAVEPMTCPPNAFNSGEDVILLAPGESAETSWGITAEGASGG